VSVLLPFSKRARIWEPAALALRRHLRLSTHQILDPYQLAESVDLRLVDLKSICDLLPGAVARQILVHGKDAWSGGVYAQTLPDGTRICILNSGHNARRMKTTLMEEIAHIHLQHSPTGLVRSVDGLCMRSYDKAQEEEAFGVGAAALIPWNALFPAINKGATIEELAERYELSDELVRYRIQITGAYKLHMARQRVGH